MECRSPSGIKRCAVWVAAAILLSSGALDVAAGPADRPNILLLVSDDHGYPLLGAYGCPHVATPVLDGLAAEGMLFDRFFTGAPQCVPSRACLMTGRSAVAARMTRFTAPLPRDQITLPELLREKAGYYTGICGRTAHLDGNARQSALSAEIYERHGLTTMAERVDSLETGPDAKVADQVAAFLDRRPADRPFFMWANFSDPHHPWDAEAALRPDPAAVALPPYLPDLPGIRADLADVCAEVSRLDRTIGSVLDVLRQRGLFEKTLIVFCGDNGTALPRGKGSLHDPGCNVPFLVRWPGVVPPRGRSRALISGEDVAPTLLAAAGVAPPAAMTGVSFLPLLQGKPFEPRRHVFMERGPHGNAAVSVDITSSGYDLCRAVRGDRWKLIYNCTPWVPYRPVDSGKNPGWREMVAADAEGRLPAPFAAAYFAAPRPIYELFDLDDDPGELHNLAGRPEHAAIQRELAQALYEKMILDGDYLPLPAIPAADADAAQGRPARADD